VSNWILILYQIVGSDRACRATRFELPFAFITFRSFYWRVNSICVSGSCVFLSCFIFYLGANIATATVLVRSNVRIGVLVRKIYTFKTWAELTSIPFPVKFTIVFWKNQEVIQLIQKCTSILSDGTNGTVVARPFKWVPMWVCMNSRFFCVLS
jgi:hypothetical protein